MSCNNNNKLPVIAVKTGKDMREVRLGHSKYYLKLPGNFRIEEARGKEGQLGYNIIQKDTSSKIYAFGFVEVLRGNPIGGTDDEGWPKIASARSSFLNRQVTWNIYKTPTGYFDAETSGGEEVSGDCTSNKRNEIDSLIAIIATLREK
jgi:hypothetical protein